jgi:hypothetical protein
MQSCLQYSYKISTIQHETSYYLKCSNDEPQVVSIPLRVLSNPPLLHQTLFPNCISIQANYHENSPTLMHCHYLKLYFCEGNSNDSGCSAATCKMPTSHKLFALHVCADLLQHMFMYYIWCIRGQIGVLLLNVCQKTVTNQQIFIVEWCIWWHTHLEIICLQVGEQRKKSIWIGLCSMMRQSPTCRPSWQHCTSRMYNSGKSE